MSRSFHTENQYSQAKNWSKVTSNFLGSKFFTHLVLLLFVDDFTGRSDLDKWVKPKWPLKAEAIGVEIGWWSRLVIDTSVDTLLRFPKRFLEMI